MDSFALLPSENFALPGCGDRLALVDPNFVGRTLRIADSFIAKENLTEDPTKKKFNKSVDSQR